MCRWLVAAALALGGCALVGSANTDPIRDLSTSGPQPDLEEGIISNDDMAAPPLRDDAGRVLLVDMASPPGATIDMALLACAPAEHFVINEVQTGGSSSTSDEFIEIYNPCATAQNIGGFKLLHRSATGTTDTPQITIPAGKTVAGNGYFLVTGPAYSGKPPFDIQYTSAMLAASGGGLGLKDLAGKLVDSMGWGSTATNAYVVGQPATASAAGKSMARTPNGSGSHMNDALDFAVATPTPRAKN